MINHPKHPALERAQTEMTGLVARSSSTSLPKAECTGQFKPSGQLRRCQSCPAIQQELFITSPVPSPVPSPALPEAPSSPFRARSGVVARIRNKRRTEPVPTIRRSQSTQLLDQPDSSRAAVYSKGNIIHMAELRITLPWERENLRTYVRDDDVLSPDGRTIVLDLFQSIHQHLKDTQSNNLRKKQNETLHDYNSRKLRNIGSLIQLCRGYALAMLDHIPNSIHKNKLTGNPKTLVHHLLNDLRIFIGEDAHLCGKFYTSKPNWLQLRCLVCGKFCEILSSITKVASRDSRYKSHQQNIEAFSAILKCLERLSSCHCETAVASERLYDIVSCVIDLMGDLHTLPDGAYAPMLQILKDHINMTDLKPLPDDLELPMPQLNLK